MNTISIIFSFAASVFLLVMVVFILYKDWRDQVNRYYAFYNISALGILFTMFLTYAFPESFSLTKLNRITQMFTAFVFAGLFMMSLVFPKREVKFPFRVAFAVLIPAFVVGGLAAFTDLTITRAYFNKNGELVREFRVFYTIYAVVVISYLLAGSVNFIRKYITTKVKIYRLQMRYVFVGASLAVIFAAGCSIILPRFFNYTKLYVIGPSIAAFIATVALFYSVVTYSLMDIRSVVHKTVMYGIISTVIFVPIYAIMEAVNRNLFELGSLPMPLTAFAIVAVFILFSALIQPLIDRLFKRKQYQFEDLVDNFILETEKLRSHREIVEKSVEILVGSLYLNRAFYIHMNDQSRRYELFYHKSSSDREFTVTPLERSHSLVRWFVKNQEILLLDRIYTDEKSFSDVSDDLLAFFVENGVQLAMPIYHERRLSGLLCLGEKESLAGYHPDEIEKLGFFLRKSNDFISTALSHDKAMKEQMLSRTIGLSSKLLSITNPRSLPRISALKFGAFIVPKYAEGCDYFDFIRASDQGIGIIVSDISGIGVNSSIYSILLKSGTQAGINESHSTAAMMQNLNRLLCDYSRGKGGLVTAYYTYFDFKSMRIMYTNAGFPAMDVYRIDKSNFDTMDTEGIPLGYDASITYGAGRTNLQKGDIGVLYTKTLINSKNQKGEEFGLLRLRGLISENRMRNASDIADLIRRSFQSFMGLVTPYSDVILLIFKVM
jgi:hypothetical protein